jgi:hypothetical protein
VQKRSEVAEITAELRARLQACFDEALRRAGGAPEPVTSAPQSREHV